MPQAVGQLFVVATPIGNLDDMGMRAIELLRQVDLVAAEDTRHSRRLLAHFNIDAPLTALHEHNERARHEGLIARLRAGERIALVSDAGTPLVSDPGFVLVRACHDAGIRVSPVPGPASPIAGLSVSGLPTDRFLFEGFLPAGASERARRLETLAAFPHTLVMLESCHRVADTLQALVGSLGPTRTACLCRELTKTFETVRRAELDELAAWVTSDPDQQRGEIVLVVAGADPRPTTPVSELDRFLVPLLAALPLKQAVKIAAEQSGHGKNDLYTRALELKSHPKG